MKMPFLPGGCDLGCKMTCMNPHSMQTERIVSHHNLVVDTILGERTARLMLALNGVGTAYFYPRPAVIKFVEKTRRCGAQDWDIHGQREFVGKFSLKMQHG